MLPSTRGTSAANHCAMPLLNGRPILAFLRALVGAFKAKKSFVPQFASFSGHSSDVTGLIGGKTPLKDTSEKPPKPRVARRQSQCRYFDTVWADRGVTPYLGVSWRRCRGRIAQRSRNQPRKSSNLALEKAEHRPPLPNMRRRGIW
jgi:hypothetical protein